MISSVQALISGNPEKVPLAIRRFLEKSNKLFDFPELNQNNYRKELWRALHSYMSNARMQQVHVECLSAIRILSRDKTELNEIISDDLLNTVIEHASLKDDRNFDDQHIYQTSIEALKCLCNLIYNSKVAAKICSKNGTLEGIIRRLRTYRDARLPSEIKYFDMKILFLITAICVEARARLTKELHGLPYLIETLDLILKESGENDQNPDVHGMDTSANLETLTEEQVDLACEILKVLFNVTLYATRVQDEEEEGLYIRLVAILHDYLVATVENEKKRHELHNHVINLLTNMPNQTYKSLIAPIQDGQILSKDMQFEEENMHAVHQILIFLMKRFQTEPTVSSQREMLSPVLTVILRAAISDRSLRKYLRTQILPPLKDVHNRPEQGNTIRNYMCRLLTTPITQVKNVAAEIIFVLCKENVNRMIKYTGYGNAAGLFASRGLLHGKHGVVSRYSSDSENSDTEEYTQHKHGINPVMGCYEAPHPNPTANMTEEQKEYEAMKLVELMDNLTRTGVVRPCKIGDDGRPEPLEHVLQLQDCLRDQQIRMDDDSD